MAVVFAILAVEHRSPLTRNDSLKFCKLLEKESGKIKLSSMVEALPAVPPPDIVFVDRVRTIRAVCAQDAFTRGITGPPIELSLVAEGHELAHALIRMEVRNRHTHLFAKRDLPIRNFVGFPSAAADEGLGHKKLIDFLKRALLIPLLGGTPC